MGHLADGRWRSGAQPIEGGAFVRKPTSFRGWVSEDAAQSEFKAEPNRYHLYVSLACPWASRAVMVRKLKHLESVIPMTVVHPDMLENGWTFKDTHDPVNGFDFLYQLYQAADPHFSGRVTVPVLWDTKTRTIVNNESADIIRMFNRAFDAWGDSALDLYPADIADDIDALNARVYDSVNNAVYRAGFATSQAAYQAAVWDIFNLLEELEQRLASKRYLFGARMTEADIRLFTTGVRFDLVYYGHFKCNIRHWWDYPNLWGWLRDMYQTPGVDETVDLDQIKRHYYGSQRWVNPSGIVPSGPSIDLRAPHHRQHLA